MELEHEQHPLRLTRHKLPERKHGQSPDDPFLANVNSRSRSLYAIARPSACRLTSVTLVHPTQAVKIFGNISTTFGTLVIR